MVHNLILIIGSTISMTNVSLAMSKIVLLLDEYNYKYDDYVQITTLAVNTQRSTHNYGEIIVQIAINDIKIKSKFFMQLESMINTIAENYKVKIKKLCQRYKNGC